ncbi:MAG TPA: murein biosynthesis integral membrane protein MurJ [Candidatus Acidoferrales bacterium]|nr:murein biosynthesis integral membrane protein MurJ [Candidatus Acidoferrales bacterium]
MAQPSVNRRVVASTAIVMAGILLSRFLGFVREWVVAHQVGSNAMTDAYYAAFTLPDFLNYLVAGASLSVTFIPVFTKYAAEGREDEGWHVFSTVMTFMGLLLVAFVMAGEIFAPQLARLIAPGFPPAERARVIFLTRLMLPAQFCFYEGSILSAVQYAKGRFLVPSFAPVIYNIFIILGGMLLASRIGMTGFAVGVVTGAIVGNFLFQVYGAMTVGARFNPNLNVLHPGFKLFIRLSIPIMLALSLAFTDDWIIRWFGSYLQPASITWLNYAKTLMRVPLGVVGQGVGVASFPFLAQLYSEGKFDELNRLLNSTVKSLIAALIPISALMIAQSAPVVYLVFSHTRMRPPDLDATAATLVYFTLGLFGWGAQYILARGFYATRNTWIPAVVGTALTFATVPVYWLLVRQAQHLGLAMASSIGISAYTVIIFLLLGKRTHNHEEGALVLFFVKVCAASAVAGVVCYKLRLILEPHLAWHTLAGAFSLLVMVTAVGVLLLVGIGKLLGIRELDQQLERLWILARWNRSKTPA